MNSLSNSIFFEKPNPFGECHITKIENFEKKFSIKIPKDYRNYLCHFNGAKPINTICSFNSNGGTIVHHMYGLHNHEAYRLKVEKGMLLFAEDSFGNHFAINVSNGENYGFVYFIDTELIDTEFNAQSIVMLNKTFDAFISSLTSEDMFLDNLEKENPEIYARIKEFKKNPQI